MKTIETKGKVDANGTLIARVPSDVPEGEHFVTITIPETQDERPPKRPRRSALPLENMRLESWSAHSTFGRREIYGDEGR